MKHLRKFYESNYLDLSEIIKTLRDICIELDDNNVKYIIHPINEIGVKMLSLYLKGSLDKSIDNHRRNSDVSKFFLVIFTRMSINRKLSGNRLPDWFIEVCFRIEDFMKISGFKTDFRITYISGDSEDIGTAEDLQNNTGYISSIEIDFSYFK